MTPPETKTMTKSIYVHPESLYHNVQIYTMPPTRTKAPNKKANYPLNSHLHGSNGKLSLHH